MDRPRMAGLQRSEDAVRRLALALDRLEAAAGRPLAGSGQDADMARMRDDYARLDSATREVAERLDAAVGRLRSLLGD